MNTHEPYHTPDAPKLSVPRPPNMTSWHVLAGLTGKRLEKTPAQQEAGLTSARLNVDSTTCWHNCLACLQAWQKILRAKYTLNRPTPARKDVGVFRGRTT